MLRREKWHTRSIAAVREGFQMCSLAPHTHCMQLAIFSHVRARGRAITGTIWQLVDKFARVSNAKKRNNGVRRHTMGQSRQELWSCNDALIHTSIGNTWDRKCCSLTGSEPTRSEIIDFLLQYQNEDHPGWNIQPFFKRVTCVSRDIYLSGSVSVGRSKFDESGLIVPQKLANPCVESREVQELHREMRWNARTWVNWSFGRCIECMMHYCSGVNVLNKKSELERALERRKFHHQEQQHHANEEATGAERVRADFQKAVQDRAHRLGMVRNYTIFTIT